MGKYFTENERYILETMLSDGMSKKEIAVRLGKSLATIYNEIKRGTVELIDTELRTYKAYKADYAQRDFIEKQTAKGSNYKIGNDFDFVEFIENKIINEKWSPETIIGYVRMNKELFHFKTDICFKTLYNYIHTGLFLNVSEKNLHKYKKKSKGNLTKRPSYHNIDVRSISERPDRIDNRDEFGHWEMDTVVGKQKSKCCLLVLSERMTRTEIVRKINGKTQEEVKRVLDDLENELGTQKFIDCFKSITMDNGNEFINSEKIETSVNGGQRTTSYYCHPYSSWERGTNENINKMIRRWIPKGVDIGQYTEKEIAYIEHWINHYPRKMFGFCSSYELLREMHLVKK